MDDEMISVGIDIGTSTMQLLFSKLVIENLAGSYSVPRLSIVDKRIIYESEIAFTPMISDSLIDIERCRIFIDEQYKRAHIDYKDVKTGAVIITGESARKENSDKVLESLSCFAGDFVVATAGPSLESMLSGLGSNIGNVSKEKEISIANIDIGGGTSNISFFDKGKLCGLTCLDIGGRLIKVNFDCNKVTYVYHKIKNLVQQHNIYIEEGEDINIKKLERIAEIMVKCLAESLNLIPSSERLKYLFTNDEKELKDELKPDAVSFSGGVGDLYYKCGDFKSEGVHSCNEEETLNGENIDSCYEEKALNSENLESCHKDKMLSSKEFDSDYKDKIFKYGDIGTILAEKLKQSSYFKGISIIKPKETIRATVIGAGMHTTEISGSTITVDNSELPLKNVPILKISDKDIKNVDEIIKERLPMYLINDTFKTVALAFEGYEDVSFDAIQELAEKIICGAHDIIENNYPLVVAVENDIGKALGNSLISKLSINRINRGYKKVVCIDGIEILNGEYIDIGKTIADGQVVPVVIKTLIFNS